jgi:hypothetical protein
MNKITGEAIKRAREWVENYMPPKSELTDAILSGLALLDAAEPAQPDTDYWRKITEKADARNKKPAPPMSEPKEKIMDNETLESQVDRLANFIMAEVPGEPSQSEGAIDTAIRIIRSLQKPAPPAESSEFSTVNRQKADILGEKEGKP